MRFFEGLDSSSLPCCFRFEALLGFDLDVGAGEVEPEMGVDCLLFATRAARVLLVARCWFL